jgi:C terminal of Calcineurin-like phosphoesterase/N terminal of Calcineurin-like phosphoesterase/Calcineurin-like phosphoesterase
MQRRKFLQQIALLTGGFIASSFVPAGILLGTDTKIKGRVLSNGVGLSNVVISDGYTVIVTDRKGRYELKAHPDAIAIFISTPAGHEFIHEDGICRHYRSITEINRKKEINFKLNTLNKKDEEHQFIIWADPQVKNAKDVRKMMEESVPDVQNLVAGLAPGTLMHGITVGDIVWDELQLFAEYDKAVKQMGIPFYQCLGNHDMDYRKGGDETSDDTFQKTYGPTYYSFNRGKAHYIVMDNVRYLGKDREYDGFIQQHQLDWLQKDLSFVPPENLVILCIHIPVHSGTKNRDALYAILQNRQVHIMSGHTHYHVNAINKNIYEHNHGTVCGAWWTGPICEDGTPGGYGVYKVNGTQLSWQYKATGKPLTYQMKIYVQPYDATQKQVIVNIWNHDPAWKTNYWLDGVSKGELQQFEGIDPLAYSTMLGPDLPKPRGFAEPKKTKHLFRTIVPAATNEIKIMATDRFGNQYTDTARIS